MKIKEHKKIIRSIFQQYKQNGRINLHVTKKIFDYLQYHKLDMVCMSLNKNNRCSINVFEQRKEQISELNQLYEREIYNLINILEEKNISYVILKGWSCLISLYKNFTDRYFFDVDILVKEKELKNIEELLFAEGYTYGEARGGKIVLPERKTILFQRYFTHELYNMVKKVDNHFVNIDINFKFSWRGVGEAKINNITYDDVEKYVISTLYDNQKYNIFDVNMQFIHLCCHFFNEACYFCLNMEFGGGDPKELRLFRLLDIWLLLDKVNILMVREIAERFDCMESIHFTINILYMVMGNSIVKDIFPWEVEGEHLNHYIDRDKKWREWPLSIEERLFDLEKKNNMCAHLFSETHNLASISGKSVSTQ